jgi:hypothetical protein
MIFSGRKHVARTDYKLHEEKLRARLREFVPNSGA